MATLVTCMDCDDLLTDPTQWYEVIGLCKHCWEERGMPPPPWSRLREEGFARRIFSVTKVSDERQEP